MSISRPWTIAAVCGAFIALQAAVLWAMGQPWIAESGQIKLWEGVVQSAGNSQHIADWYTFSHIIHGLLFYWLLTLVAPKVSLGVRLALALGLEVSWEIIENTPMVIDAYRQQALAASYTGDSILNSLMDSAAMMLGFAAAAGLPVWGSIAIGLGLEALPLWVIRDGLTLNVLNLLHRFEFIARWQSGPLK